MPNLPQLPLLPSHEAWLEAGKPSDRGWRGQGGIDTYSFESIKTELTPWERAQWDAFLAAAEDDEPVSAEEAA